MAKVDLKLLRLHKVSVIISWQSERIDFEWLYPEAAQLFALFTYVIESPLSQRTYFIISDDLKRAVKSILTTLSKLHQFLLNKKRLNYHNIKSSFHVFLPRHLAVRLSQKTASLLTLFWRCIWLKILRRIASRKPVCLRLPHAFFLSIIEILFASKTQSSKYFVCHINDIWLRIWYRKSIFFVGHISERSWLRLLIL